MGRARDLWRPVMAGAMLALTLAAAARAHQDPPPAVNRDAQLIVDFSKLVDGYCELHRKLESTLPPRPQTPTPAQIDAHAAALGRLIRQARVRAEQGEIFTRDVRALFRRQIARALAGPDGKALRSSIMDENPGQIPIAVNDRYPNAPLSSMPPQVLAMLPKLPPDVEYRFIGRRLILLDVHANIVVDFIADALPR